MIDFRQDLTYAWRALRRRPGFTAVAVGTIALAIAANTAVFSIVYGVLLKPLPFREPERLVTVDSRAQTGFLVSLSIPNFRDWRDRNRVFESFGGAAGWGFTLTGDGPAEVLSARAVVGDLFGTLGLSAALGRLPSAAETADHDGLNAVVVLSHALWRQRFGGDERIIGRSITLDDRPYTVIGVMPAGIGYPDPDVEIYVPMGTIPGLPWDDRDSGFGTEAIARLKPGVDFAAVGPDLARVGREVRAELAPNAAIPESRPLATFFLGDVRTELWILMGAVAFVLLIAVANVGNLLLARGEERHKELAVRAALGAGRGALVRLLLTEALLIAAIGGALGTAAAYAAVGALIPLLPADLPAVLVPRIHVDGVVLLFAIGLALGTGVLFGLVPAWRAASLSLAESLKSGTRGATGASGRLRPALVVTEVTLALVVLIGAGLMLKSLDKLIHVEKGFDARGVLSAAAAPGTADAGDRARWHAFHTELRERAARLPGVRTAALALLLPLSQRSWELGVQPEGEPIRTDLRRSVLYNVVSPEYFEALGVPVVRGRPFTAADRDGAPLVAMIDETMAQQFWPGGDPIGKRITFEQDSAGAPAYRTVIGVTKNLRHYALERPSRIQVYVPFDQTYRRWGMGLRLVLKTDGAPLALVAPLRALVAELHPDAPLTALRPVQEYVTNALARSTAMTRVLAAFGLGALALAALGIFGVMSYDVTRRTREIGIRMALGAASRDVLRWVTARALRLTLAGVTAGLLLAVGLTRLLHSVLFEVSPLDAASFALAGAGLGIVSLLAAYLPARRATRVDPVLVLHDEG